MMVIVLVIIATGIVVLTLADSNKTSQSVQPGTGVKTTHAALVTTRITTTATPRSPIANTSTGATSQVREGNPDPEVTPAGLSPTDRSPKKAVNECTLVPFKDVNAPDADGFSFYDATVFNAISVENYSFPVGRKDPGITIEQAKEIAIKAFPEYSPDRVEISFTDGSVNDRAWNFKLYKDDQQVILGGLNADNGDLMDYRINPRVMAERWDTHPTTMDNAQQTAENEIQERNGKLPLKLVDSRSENGNYVFLYKRIIQGVPCARDGITINIDSGTGKVFTYYKSWSTPENAVAAQTVPAISHDAAIARIEREARACYPESADSFRIVSANLEWMDFYNADEFTPEPGVIPLGWYVRFDDKTIREREFPFPEEGWIDAQNGTLLSMNYFHHH
jgi:hypothetical protein